MNLTITIVTGSWENTQQVDEYYSSFGYFTISIQTQIHLKMQGTVGRLSQVFNTTFFEYKCQKNMTLICFASTSVVYIPASLNSAIVGILGLEQVLALKSNYVVGKSIGRLKSLLRSKALQIPYFIGPQVAQVYGFPNSDGSGIRVGIITLGGYFFQSDLQAYFDAFGLGKAPNITLISVDGAQLVNSDSAENYLDVEIISSVVPNANITLYFGINSLQGFFDVIYVALNRSDVVSLSWGSTEVNSVFSSYLSSFQALISLYSNVPLFVATGDYGSYGGVGFPASCPSAIGKN